MSRLFQRYGSLPKNLCENILSTSTPTIRWPSSPMTAVKPTVLAISGAILRSRASTCGETSHTKISSTAWTAMVVFITR